MTFFAFSLLGSGVQISLVCAVAGLLFAVVLIKNLMSKSPGNERMQEIAGAVQEGAKAYLNRQVVTISAIAAVIFVLLLIFKDHFFKTGLASIGFLIGAFCSLAAGYIGMRIAVITNTRTAQAATSSRTQALRVAFNGGAVTGEKAGGHQLRGVQCEFPQRQYTSPPLANRKIVEERAGRVAEPHRMAPRCCVRQAWRICQDAGEGFARFGARRSAISRIREGRRQAPCCGTACG
jgi:Na+/H+-translocating membrane pyrophosphatase